MPTLAKRQEILPLLEAGLDIQVGDVFITGDNWRLYVRVEEFETKDDGKLLIRLSRSHGKKWDRSELMSVDSFRRLRAIKLEKPIAEVEAEALAALSDISALDTRTEEDTNATALVRLKGGERILQVRADIQVRMEM